MRGVPARMADAVLAGTTAATAPAAIAAPAKSPPSKLSPRRADEQVAGRHGAAVDGDACRRRPRIAGLEAAAAGGGRLFERQRDHEARLGAGLVDTTAAVGREAELGKLVGGDLAVVEVDRLGAQDLVGLVTLAGDHERVAGARLAQREADGGAPVGLDHHVFAIAVRRCPRGPRR